jgi:2-keto-4-pentenoate hydratase
MIAVTDKNIAAAADRLIAAESSGVPCTPVRDLIGRDDVRAAYAVQERSLAHRVAAGGEVVGRKIGLTAPVQRQLGVDRPDFGMLLADMAVDDGSTIPLTRLLQPRIEAEITFVLREDLPTVRSTSRRCVPRWTTPWRRSRSSTAGLPTGTSPSVTR